MQSTRDRVAVGIEEGLSVRQIANREGITTQAVYKHLKVLDIPPPTTAKGDLATHKRHP